MSVVDVEPDRPDLADAVATETLRKYDDLGINPRTNGFSVLASFSLVASSAIQGSKSTNTTDSEDLIVKLISLATGNKCLPTSRFPMHGEVLLDSHAEILARRGAVRWLYEEIQKMSRPDPVVSHSRWLKQAEDGHWTLASDVRCYLYISSLPCGDASMGYLAATQDPLMAALKLSSSTSLLPASSTSIGQTSRGRDGYALLGVPRTKPGRADSPPTLVMSCSDKIARWNVLGFQGALLSQLMAKTFLDGIIVGDLPIELRGKVRADCDRALWGRLEGSFPEVHRPKLLFTSIPFRHSRTLVQGEVSASNESFCWVEDTVSEELVNGVRRGVGAKHRRLPHKLPALSKASLFRLYHQTRAKTKLPLLSSHTSYFDCKKAATQYQVTAGILQGEDGPLRGWLRNGRHFEAFTLEATE